MNAHRTPIDLMRDWLNVVARGRFEAWDGRVDENVVFRFPYAPPGMVSELFGATAARAAMQGWKSDESFRYHNLVIRQTDDPELVIATMSARATLSDGGEYRNDYVVFGRFRAGLLVEHVEYFDPAPVQAVMARGAGG